MNNAKRIENAVEWIRCLGTTKMKQGIGMLGDRKNGFCCLGFGCYINSVDYYAPNESSVAFQDIVGLIDELGTPNDGGLQPLATLNDDRHYTFRNISDLLKKYPEDYFTSAVAKGIQENLRSK